MSTPLIAASYSGYTTMYNPSQRNTIGGGNFWFDGMLGFFSKSGANYTAWGIVNGPKGTTIKTVGPINDIGASHTAITISGVPASPVTYASGGHVVDLDVGGTNLAMLLHYERPNATSIWSSLGFARSSNGGDAWAAVSGEFTMAVPYSPSDIYGRDIQEGPLVPVGPYYHLYFSEGADPLSDAQYYSVARCLKTDFNTFMLANTMPPFDKWQGTLWGGSNTGAQLTTLPLTDSFSDAWWDTNLGVMLRVGTKSITAAGAQIRLVASYDGINFSSPIVLTDDFNGSGEGIIFSQLIPGTITGNRTGTGPWTLVYLFGTRTASTEVRYRTLNISLVGSTQSVGQYRVLSHHRSGLILV